ncbi:MAG TPA: SH3 domain-containing protein [Bacteroidales bacterium]|nr:SH3 domain-containing protein [Bacteroidales bacterium]
MNLKKIGILFCMICFCAFTTMAQADTCVYIYGKFNDGAKVFLFADKVNIREADSPNSAILCNLPIGTPMTTISRSEKSYESNGISANWYHVGFYSDGKYCTGYVWGNLISHASIPFSENGENCLFVCAPVSRSEEDGLKMTAKIISNGKILNSLSFTPIYTEMSGSGTFEYCLSGSRLDKSGFTGVSKIFAVSFEYGACGYANGDILFFRAGNNLVEFAKAIRVSEAGIFNVSYNYIFPQYKGGDDNTLYIEERHVEYDPDKEDITITSDVTYKRKIFWDGKKGIESEKKEEINNLKLEEK